LAETRGKIESMREPTAIERQLKREYDSYVAEDDEMKTRVAGDLIETITNY
jgi:hypothetical protein